MEFLGMGISSHFSNLALKTTVFYLIFWSVYEYLFYSKPTLLLDCIALTSEALTFNILTRMASLRSFIFWQRSTIVVFIFWSLLGLVIESLSIPWLSDPCIICNNWKRLLNSCWLMALCSCSNRKRIYRSDWAVGLLKLFKDVLFVKFIINL